MEKSRFSERQDWKTERASRGDEARVVARQLNRLTAPVEKIEGGQVQRVQRTYGHWERLERMRQDWRSQLDIDDPVQQLTYCGAVRRRQTSRVDPIPDFVLEQAARRQRLQPQILRREPILCE